MILGFFSISAFPALAKKFNRKNVFYACILIMFCGAGLLVIAGKNLALVVLAMEMFAAPQAVIFLVILNRLYQTFILEVFRNAKAACMHHNTKKSQMISFQYF